MSERYELLVESKSHAYLISNNSDLVKAGVKRRIIIFDSQVKVKCLEIFSDSEFFIEVNVTEERKNLDSVQDLLSRIADYGATRDDQIVAVGGGALQDLVTLTASIYMRGLEWIYVPTTLMAMLDSCIGGKSSINLNIHKNILGNFYPPKSVFVHIDFLKTLKKIDIASGLAEGVKICFASDISLANHFQELSENWQLEQESRFILDAIFLSLRTKKWFIEIDEFDKRERRLLNFGHSFGHALESASNYLVPHGIGVFIGMQAAISYSKNSEVCQELSNFICGQMIKVSDLVPTFQLNRQVFLDAIRRDKKNSETEQILILPNESGVLEEVRFRITADGLEKALEVTLEALVKLGVKHEVL